MTLFQFIVFEVICLIMILLGSFSLVYKLLGTPNSAKDETNQMIVSGIISVVITIASLLIMIANFPTADCFR